MYNKIKIYGFWGLIELIVFKIKTFVFYRNSRLIRFPLVVRGKGNIDFGKGLTTGVGCRIEAYQKENSNKKVIHIGKNVQINDYVHITGMNKVVIGDNVLMASKIYISDSSHGFYEGGDNDSNPDQIPIDRKYKVGEVIIGDNVWLGEFVSVLPDVIIGKGSIIGANSVVTKNIPAYSIAVGSPARVIRKYNFSTQRWEIVKKD